MGLVMFQGTLVQTQRWELKCCQLHGVFSSQLLVGSCGLSLAVVIRLGHEVTNLSFSLTFA